MISMKELIKDTPISDISLDIQHNLEEVLLRINKIRTAYNKPMKVTSGYRTMQDHIRIYNRKGIMDPKKIPMQSKHLYGKAVDISDPNQDLQKWCLTNIKMLEDVGLWLEDFSATPNWVHFQIEPPKSGKRMFKP